MRPFLSDDEVAELCDPLIQPHAQKKHLKKLGIPFKEKPNGRPIVDRDSVFKLADQAIAKARTTPNKAALLAKLGR